MNKLEKYMVKKKLAHALMEKLAKDPNVVVKTPKPGVTTMDFKRGTTIYGGNPPAHIQKARDTANRILKPLNKILSPPAAPKAAKPKMPKAAPGTPVAQKGS